MPLKRTWAPRISVFCVVTALIFGAIIHIIAVFALPYATENNAWLKVAQRVPANRLQLLPLATPERQILPYMAPDVVYSLCRYDLRDGPVALRIPELGALWSISLYDKLSQNFYTVAGQDLQRDSLELLLNLPRSEADAINAQAGRAKTQSETITVRVPTADGLAVIRAPIEGVTGLVRDDERYRNISCERAK